MKTYTIKPLVWENADGNWWIADTIIGMLTVNKYKDAWDFGKAGNCNPESFDTLEAAKLAAEEWYITQIEQALEQVT